MNFYNWYDKLKNMEMPRFNDINGDWSLKTIQDEDMGMAVREEPTEDEVELLKARLAEKRRQAELEIQQQESE